MQTLSFTLMVLWTLARGQVYLLLPLHWFHLMSFLGFPCFVAILKRTLAKECIGLGMKLCTAYQLKRLPEGMQNKHIHVPWCQYMWFRGYTVELLKGEHYWDHVACSLEVPLSQGDCLH